MDPTTPAPVEPGPAPQGAPAPPAPIPPGAPAPAEPALDLDAVAADLAAVEVALTRLDEGTYGRCDACGDVIDDEWLAARPVTTTCAAHLPTL